MHHKPLSYTIWAARSASHLKARAVRMHTTLNMQAEYRTYLRAYHRIFGA